MGGWGGEFWNPPFNTILAVIPVFLLKNGTSAVDSRTIERVPAETAGPQPHANYLFFVISSFWLEWRFSPSDYGLRSVWFPWSFANSTLRSIDASFSRAEIDEMTHFFSLTFCQFNDVNTYFDISNKVSNFIDSKDNKCSGLFYITRCSWDYFREFNSAYRAQRKMKNSCSQKAPQEISVKHQRERE